MNSKTYEQLRNDPDLENLLGQTLLRDDLLVEILGDEYHEILYWAGKRLGRKYRLANYESLSVFFKQFCLGDLTLVKQGKNQLDFELTGKIIESRLLQNDDPDFQLECGLLAQFVEYILNRQSEAEISKINAKKGLVSINVLTSSEPPLDGQESDEIFKLITEETDD